MRRSNHKILKFLIYFILPWLFFVVLIVSFFAFKKLVLPFDKTLKGGKKLSIVASERRVKLLKREDLTPVFFNSKDGIKLSGYFINRKNPIGNVVLCHGYQSAKEFLGNIIDMLPEYNILLFDFRAHGKSEGRFRTIGYHEYKDLFAAVDFLKDKTKSKIFSSQLPLYIMGISMGGAVAIDATARRPDLCDGLVVDSAFSNLKDVIYNAFKAKSGLPKYPFVPILIKVVNFVTNSDIVSFSPLQSIKTVKQPVLFIHSCIDDIVNPSDTLEMYAKSSNENSKLWIAPVCRHARLHRKYPEIYQKKIRKFLNKIT
ncbi:MAG: alpha/beta fold hydrolase [bacterium]